MAPRVLALVLLATGCSSTRGCSSDPARASTAAATAQPVRPSHRENIILEFPDDGLATSREAIVEALRRVRIADAGQRWVLLSAQGQGGRLDSRTIADVHLHGDVLDFGEPVSDLAALVAHAGLDAARIKPTADMRGARIAAATSPEQLAGFLIVLYREHFGIRPFLDDGDYAFGAEWEAPSSFEDAR